MSMSQAERDAEDAKWEAERPMREWLAEIKEADSGITARVIEDIFDALPPSAKVNIPQETQDKLANLKEIRARKPQE